MKIYAPGIAVLLCFSLLDARQENLTCGTHAETWRDEVQLHRQSSRRGLNRVRKAAALTVAGEREVAGVAVRPDIGNLAVLDDSGGVIARRNPFNLNGQTLSFLPDSSTLKYRYELVKQNTYDEVVAESSTPLSTLKDDDSQETPLPFEFPFWGVRYRSVFVNSDGNLSFGVGDPSAVDRSLGRFASLMPRIAALYRDLDPSRSPNSVRITGNANRVIVSWVQTREYRDTGTGTPQTFQIRLYPDGKIELAFAETTRTNDAVTGISRGSLQGATNVVSFLNEPTGEYTSSIAERFAGSEEVDIFSAAQKFYLNHEDSYDYLVFYNTLGVPAGSSAVAFETTIRNSRKGYGDAIVDIGAETGSKRRLQALLNMGPLNQYPRDPNARVPARLSTGDTPLTTLAHEAGHLFLAFASVRDPNDADARPMLGYQSAHWNFVFNSEASLLEGNRIQDNGPNASPRFLTTGTVEGFSPLDQYLMGFRPPSEVPDTFLVTNPRGSTTTGTPRLGVAFDGQRRDIRIDEIVQAEGRRIPDHTVSQRRFRFAFIVITASGAEPSETDLSQVETYRREFEAFYAKAASNNASADTSLKRGLRVSVFPAAGVPEGSAGTGTIGLEAPAAAPMTLILRSSTGGVELPASVVIPAGAAEARFTFRGRRQGADDVIVEPSDSQFETVQSRVQVSSADALKLSVVSGDLQTATPGRPLARPVAFRVSDQNELPYPGVTVQLSLAGGGSVSPSSGVTDETGTISFTWTPGAESINELRAALPNGTAVVATALGRPAFAASAVVNAASFAAGLTPGGIATVFGANLSDGKSAEVLVNGQPTQIFYAGPRQVNFLVPLTARDSTADLSIRTAAGTSEIVRVSVATLQPGIFFDAASGYGAILVAGTGQLTQQRPVGAGEVIEIYTTGLGSTQIAPAGPLRETAVRPLVTVGGIPAEVLFSGLAPGFSGLYQVNVRMPAGISSGQQSLRLSAGASASNEVKIQIR